VAPRQARRLISNRDLPFGRRRGQAGLGRVQLGDGLVDFLSLTPQMIDLALDLLGLQFLLEVFRRALSIILSR